MIKNTKNCLSLLLCGLIFFINLISFSGCHQVKTPITKTGVYFDTVISITLYEANSSELIDECFTIADSYELLLSKSIEGSDVYNINNSYNEWIKVDSSTYYLISESFKYEELSDGRFSVMCGALTDLWDISEKMETLSSSSDNVDVSDNLIPTEAEIASAKALCGKSTIELDPSSSSVKINKKGAKLDLGAVAKGYIADMMKEYLISQGVESGIIQLGGNVLLIGSNPTKDSGLFTVGIQTPFYGESGNSESIITSVSETDKSIVTSGNYQRYFEYDGEVYHHIIDLTTGYPAESGLNSVTIICDKSFDADALSTVCFLLGKKEAEKALESLHINYGVEISPIFIDSNNNVLN